MEKVIKLRDKHGKVIGEKTIKVSVLGCADLFASMEEPPHYFNNALMGKDRHGKPTRKRGR